MDNKEDLEKEAKEFNKQRMLIIECCKLNNIDPIRFLAISTGIMAQQWKNTGGSLESLKEFMDEQYGHIKVLWDKLDE